MFCPSFLRFYHVTSLRSISISRLTYTLLNHAKLGQKLFYRHREVDRNYYDRTILRTLRSRHVILRNDVKC